jgi:hypothetical protein
MNSGESNVQCGDKTLLEASSVNPQSKNLRRWTKWILFGGFLLTVPVPFFMLVVGGIVPTFCIIYLAVHGLIVALPKFTAEGFWMLGILWAHPQLSRFIGFRATTVRHRRIYFEFFKISPPNPFLIRRKNCSAFPRKVGSW